MGLYSARSAQLVGDEVHLLYMRMQPSKIRNAPLAQLVEQLIYTEKVGGSSPSGRTKHKSLHCCRLLCREPCANSGEYGEVGSGKCASDDERITPDHKARFCYCRSMELPILYEDEQIVAINKPAGLITHSDGRTEEPTAEDWFNEKYPNSGGGYVHRLDRDTSGVLLFAKNQTAYEFLRRAFHDREVQKTYLAIVHGTPKAKKGMIDFDIGRSRSDFRLRSAQPKAKGRLRGALTRYEVVDTTEENGKSYSLLVVKPETGRTHQIRVHLKAVHHPIVGDKLYAPNQVEALGLERLALHAYELDLPLPEGRRVVVRAPLTEELRQGFSHFTERREAFASI
jgi:23S rRNA pseudouridine1911/1915/1917 synthase